jgi:aspartate/methionine/tyrosine aminotransferase
MLSTLHARPIDETRVVVTASGMAAIAVALSAVLRAGDRVLLHEPGWPNVGNAVRLRGAEVETVTLGAGDDGGFTFDLSEFADRLVGCRAFVLNSPNNPTGWTATTTEIEAILRLCRRHGVWLIADEVYSRLIYDQRAAAPSVLDIADPTDRVIVCNSFSKTYAMTGWRLGWLVVPEGTRETIAEIVEVTHSGVAPFAQTGALAALADEDFVGAFRAHCATGRRLAVEAAGAGRRVLCVRPDRGPRRQCRPRPPAGH